MDTLYLDPQTWDLLTDSNGNIAMATDEYAIAQDVASAGLLWKGEHIYNSVRGIPYKNGILGQRPSIAMLADWYTTEGLTVPNVAAVNPVFQFDQRKLSGQLQITTDNGEQINVNIG